MQTIKCDVSMFSLVPVYRFYKYTGEVSEADGTFLNSHRYGHAAARGLDLHPYSFGLDSGAVYGRSFSALIVNGKEWKNGHVKSKKLDSVDVAIAGRYARVYSMKTKKPKD